MVGLLVDKRITFSDYANIAKRDRLLLDDRLKSHEKNIDLQEKLEKLSVENRQMKEKLGLFEKPVASTTLACPLDGEFVGMVQTITYNEEKNILDAMRGGKVDSFTITPAEIFFTQGKSKTLINRYIGTISWVFESGGRATGKCSKVTDKKF